MFKKLFFYFILTLITFETNAQRVGYVETDRIVELMPEYLDLQKELNSTSARWNREIDEELQKVELIKKQLEIEKVLLTENIISQREDEIKNRLNSIYTLKNKRFGPDGQYFQLQNQLLAPVQEVIYDAISSVAKRGNYAIIFEKKADINILYATERSNLTDEVLVQLGYDKDKKLFKNIALKNALKKGFKEQFLLVKDAVKTSVKKSIEQTKEQIKESINTTKETLKENVKKTKESIVDAVKSGKESLNKTKESVKESIDKTKESIKKSKDDIVNTVNETKDKAKKIKEKLDNVKLKKEKNTNDSTEK